MKIIYIGPIAKKNKPAAGGFEAANRKNIQALEDRDISVNEICYPEVNHKFDPFGKFIYIKTFIYPILLVPFIFRRKEVYLHITPLLRFLYLPTFITLFTAYLLGIKSILDIRAGSFIRYYNKGSKIRRFFIRQCVKYASGVCVEGTPYVDFIKNELNCFYKKIHYFPNLCDNGQFLTNVNKKDIHKICYFGRITKNKGVGIMVETMRILGDKFQLYLYGPVDNTIDYNIFNHSNIHYEGSKNIVELKKAISDKSFFIFPSIHEGEGQSNSLIEAMSNGLIPIVSNNGFNKDVIADCGYLLPINANADDYANAIKKFIQNKDLVAEQIKCVNQIIRHHNINKEIDKLLLFYKSL
ncbi:glycosyltransferase family 4 protein [Segatella bryantii]|uniref:glycosyltransferase family 4 protein n=1 Tax=Segatella bryantii TaxID=77095 RepID=UPI00241F7D66|nr:glycosyltransferase family 4 protein [Segatella bryantii]